MYIFFHCFIKAYLSLNQNEADLNLEKCLKMYVHIKLGANLSSCFNEKF